MRYGADVARRGQRKAAGAWSVTIPRRPASRGRMQRQLTVSAWRRAALMRERRLAWVGAHRALEGTVKKFSHGRDPGRLALILSGRWIAPWVHCGCTVPSGRCVHRARRRITVHGSRCGTVP